MLGPLEAEVMGVLWRAGKPLPVREVAAALNAGRDAALAYTTVMTVMSRLAGKGILARSRSGRRSVYAPVAADAAEIAVRAGPDGDAPGSLEALVAQLDAGRPPSQRLAVRRLLASAGTLSVLAPAFLCCAGLSQVLPGGLR
jgi:hypothetical protein